MLTGAYRTETQTVITYSEIIVCEDPRDPNARILKSTLIIDPDDCYPQTVEVKKTVTVVISQESDGLLPIDTPQAWPGCLKKVEVPFTNHASIKWNQNTRDEIEKVFNGTTVSTRKSGFFVVGNRM